MTEPLRFVPPRVALTDPRTGMVAREWYLFFQGVFNRVGGATGSSTTDIVASLFEDAGSSETNAMLFELDQGVNQKPLYPQLPASEADQTPVSQPLDTIDALQAELSELRDVVAELKKDLDSIRQGILI